jgi:hypothetical protein
MHENKLICLLAALERKEMTRFRAFAHSPYFNKHSDVRALVGYLEGIYPQFTEKNCERKILFRQVFPGEKHRQARLAIVFTYTLRLLEHFLAVEWFEATGRLQSIALLQQLRQRKQYRHYEKVREQTEERFQSHPQQDSEQYWQLYRLAGETDAYFDQRQIRQHDQSIQRKQDNLDYFFLAEKLKDACEMQVRRKILKVDFQPRFLQMALEEVAGRLDHYRRYPAIFVYYRLYRMLTEDTSQYYFEALANLKEQEQYFTISELKVIYNYFQNYCIERINRNQPAFLAELFKLYQSQLEIGLLIEDDFLSEWHYKNIVTTALRLGEMDWCRAFIEDYREKLRPEARENAYRFNLANYYYAVERYPEVLPLLTQVTYNDLRYSLGAKALLLRTYYDLEEFEALYSLTGSFRQFLLRNKLMADSRRAGYYNLFKFTQRAARIKAQAGFRSREKLCKELQKLTGDVQKADAIFNKSWLEEKIGELAGEID